MRQASQELIDALSGSFQRETTLNVYTASNRVLEGARFESWQLSSDLGRAIVGMGSGTVVHASVDGESLVPVGTKGILSPFRARVEPVVTIQAGEFRESVSLGTYRVMAVPSAEDFVTQYEGREIVTASQVTVKFDSLDRDVERWGFQSPETSPAGASAFDEIRRFTNMAVEQTVDDVPLPSLKTWEAKQGGRLDAVMELGKILGGQAVVNSRGAWVIIPDEVGEPVATLRLGELGTVTNVETESDTDTVYNEVIGAYEAADGTPIYAVARVQSGPLSVDGPYGVHTRYHASDLVETQAQGDVVVQSVLEQSIGSQQYRVRIQCHFNPLVEIGDVVDVEGWIRPLVGRLDDVTLSDGPLMNVTMLVHRELT